GKRIERRQAGCLPSAFQVDFRADTPGERRLAAFRRKHPGQKQQIACLHRFRIRAERLGRYGELDTKFLQPTFGAVRGKHGVDVCHRGAPLYHPNVSTKTSTLSQLTPWQKASRSALTWSFCVVHMPCDAPLYTWSVAFLMIFAASSAESAIGTIWSSSPCRIRVGTSNFLRSSVRSVSENALIQK